ncbi:beta-ketoacyl-ACP synthase II [Dehalococcoides mccartyi]|uniref:3-oxoacyl-[acyl-carrier-protein] synthase 2 n=2 Tax=Dehalococcoides mccartyi TaxID=61435 RepID=A0AB38Z838_9CHLR|nr:beta-ketoacyl-ACP synthase II [Dehalococcoides mccartyi]WRO06687.1 beta-ketoacyl-ACP synthase II [Dehalococcoides mccartyi]
MKMENRVVVTGIGIISPLGLDLPTTWQALIAAKSGVGYITLFDTSDFDVRIAAEVKGFDPLQYIDRKQVRRTDRFTQFAIVASLEAAKNALLKIDSYNGYEVGVIIGSGMGGLTTLSQQLTVLSKEGPGRVSPFLIPVMIPDMASGQVSIQIGAKGPNYGVVSACASGAHAIGNAFTTIRQGDADVMLAGGSEAVITPIAVAGFANMKALSTRNNAPTKASRPFDAGRNGFVMGEGAAVLVMENLDFALKRGALILAELAGYGATADAYHFTEPPESGENVKRAMRLALQQAHLNPEDIDCINAHSTSTRLNDAIETKAIKALFGECAYKVPISANKSMLGHLIGVAGAISSAIAVLEINNGIIPPTINLENPDTECDLDYAPNLARQVKVRNVLVNSFGFGGHNASLVFRAYNEQRGERLVCQS